MHANPQSKSQNAPILNFVSPINKYPSHEPLPSSLHYILSFSLITSLLSFAPLSMRYGNPAQSNGMSWGGLNLCSLLLPGGQSGQKGIVVASKRLAVTRWRSASRAAPLLRLGRHFVPKLFFFFFFFRPLRSSYLSSVAEFTISINETAAYCLSLKKKLQPYEIYNTMA